MQYAPFNKYNKQCSNSKMISLDRSQMLTVLLKCPDDWHL